MNSSCHIGAIDNDRNRYRMWAYQNNSPCSWRSHLNSTNFNNNFKDNFMWEKVKSTMVVIILSFAWFMFFHHLYLWERSQIAFWWLLSHRVRLHHKFVTQLLNWIIGTVHKSSTCYQLTIKIVNCKTVNKT